MRMRPGTVPYIAIHLEGNFYPRDYQERWKHVDFLKRGNPVYGTTWAFSLDGKDRYDVWDYENIVEASLRQCVGRIIHLEYAKYREYELDRDLLCAEGAD